MPAPVGGDESADRLDQRRQRRFGVGGHREIRFGVSLKLLVVAAHEQIVGGDADALRVRPPRSRAGEVAHLEADDEIGVGERGGAAVRLIERMPGREVHPPFAIDDGRLQQLGQLDQLRQARRCARHPIDDDHGILGGGQEPRRFRDGAGVALRRRGWRELRDAQRVAGGDAVLLQLGVRDDRDRRHRRRHRDLVRRTADSAKCGSEAGASSHLM